jgi:hypothetical protein
MSNAYNSKVLIPFMKRKVKLVVDVHRHPTMELIANWGPAIKKKVEEACFANYKAIIASIGLSPSIPRIRKPNEVWKHLEVESIRIDACVGDVVVLHLVPSWNIDLQIELCIKGDEIVYAGQFLSYPVDAYCKLA